MTDDQNNQFSERDRLIDAGATNVDTQDSSLRPVALSEFIGQQQLRDNLKVFVDAARGRQESCQILRGDLQDAARRQEALSPRAPREVEVFADGRNQGAHDEARSRRSHMPHVRIRDDIGRQVRQGPCAQGDPADVICRGNLEEDGREMLE